MMLCSTFNRLVLYGLTALICCGCHTQARFAAPSVEPAGIIRYRTWISRGDMEISGIAVVRAQDGEVLGSVVNEFGVKAFDFSYAGKRCRLLHVVGPLDRWYVRQAVGRDLTIWLQHRGAGADDAGSAGPRTWQRSAESLELQNTRTGIMYIFKELE